MLSGRYNFGIASIGKFIYVVSGFSNNDTCDSVDVFDMRKNRWKRMSARFPAFCLGITLVTVKSRFIFAFGGLNPSSNLTALE